MMDAIDKKIEFSDNRSNQLSESKKLRICVFGTENSRKSDLCNLIIEDNENTTFKRDDAKSEPRIQKATIYAIQNSKSFYFVNTPDYWNANKKDQTNFESQIRELGDMSGILIALNGEDSEQRFENNCRNILRSLMQIYYKYIFDNVGIIITNWNASSDGSKRQKLEKLINRCIEEECGYGADDDGKNCKEVQIFFIDTEAGLKGNPGSVPEAHKIRVFCHELLEKGHAINGSVVKKKNKKPRVYCVLGTESVGKSALCNALCGDISRATFKETAASQPARSKRAEMKVFQKGTPDEYIIIDAFAFVDSFQEIKKAVNAEIGAQMSVSHYLLVLNGQELPYDKKFPLIFAELIKSYGASILNQLSIVSTNWETDAKSEYLRKVKGFTEDNHRDQINSVIKNVVSKSGKPETRDIRTHFVGLSAFGNPDEAYVTQEEKQKITTNLEAIKKDIKKEFPADKTMANVPVICVLGLAGAGKSSLCNALCGDETRKKFPVSSGAGTQSTGFDLENVTWKGEKNEREFMLLDTCGFSDPNLGTDEFISSLLAHIQISGYVKQFLLVLNSSEPRLDKKFKEMIDLLIRLFGKEIFKYISVVFTRWEASVKLERQRSKQGISEKSKKDEINDYLRSKSGEDTLFDCFFIDCSAFGENLDGLEEQEIKSCEKELNRIKETCLDSPNDLFDCQHIVKPIFEEQKIEAYIKTVSNDVYSTAIAKRKEIISKIDNYFDSRDKEKPFTLYSDVYTTLDKYKKNNGIDGQLNPSDERLLEYLNQNLPNKIAKNLGDMLSKDEQEFVNWLKDVKVLPKDPAQKNFLSNFEFISKLLKTIKFFFANGTSIDELSSQITQHIAYTEKVKALIVENADNQLSKFVEDLLSKS